MRKLAYFILVVAFLYGCNSKLKETEEGSTFQSLLSKYKDISFDTLHVFSRIEVDNGSYKFAGTVLDSMDVLLFPDALSQPYEYEGFWACYKFPIDSNSIGLITRTPSAHSSTSIKLLVFDKQQNQITAVTELSDKYIDAGDTDIKNSWLIKDKDNKYNSFIWSQESHDNRDDDNQTDTTVQTWNHYALLDIANSKIDTVKVGEKELLKKFGGLLKLKKDR